MLALFPLDALTKILFVLDAQLIMCPPFEKVPKNSVDAGYKGRESDP